MQASRYFAIAATLAFAASATPAAAETRVLITSVTINQVPQEPLSADDLPKPPPLAAVPPVQRTTGSKKEPSYMEVHIQPETTGVGSGRTRHGYNPDALSRSMTPRQGIGGVKKRLKFK